MSSEQTGPPNQADPDNAADPAANARGSESSPGAFVSGARAGAVTVPSAAADDAARDDAARDDAADVDASGDDAGAAAPIAHDAPGGRTPETRPSARTWLMAVAVVTVVQLLGRAWVLTGRTFYWDDFIIVGAAADAPWWSAEYLLQEHDGHLAPLSFLVQALANIAAPWQWWLPAALMFLGQAAVTVTLAHAIRLIAGRSWQAVGALALAAWTPLTLPGSTWWSAAINAIPMQLALAGLTAAAIKVSLRRETPAGWGTAAAWAAALLLALGFFEKSLAVMPLALAFTIAVAYGERRNIRETLLRGWRLWAATGAVTVAWAVFYALTALGDAGEASTEPRGDLFTNGLGQVFAGLVGGPWSWDRWAPGQPWADAPGVLVTVGAVAVLLAAAASVGRDYRSWMPWLIAAGYLGVVLASVTFMRSGEHTSDTLARTLHYYGDTAIVIAFAFAVAWSDRVLPMPVRSRKVVAAAAAVLLVSSAVSVVGYRSAWQGDNTREWLATATESLARANAEGGGNGDGEADVPNNLLDQPVPYEVLLPVAYPKNMYSQVFRDLRDRPEFGDVAFKPRMFDDSGNLVDATVAEITRVPQGDVEACGTQLIVGPDGTASAEVELTNIARLGDWVIELNAISSEPLRARLSLPNPFETPEQTLAGSTVVDLDDRLLQRWVAVAGGGNTLRIDVEGAPAGASVCVGSGAIGPLVPAND